MSQHASRHRSRPFVRVPGTVAAPIFLSILVAAPAFAGRLLDNADRQAEVARPLEFRPADAFDPQAAQRAMQPGSGRVRGVLFHQLNDDCRRTRGLLAIRKRANAGIELSLFPATPHLVEYVGLLEAHRYKATPALRNPFARPSGGKREVLFYDARMLDYGLSAKTDEFGRYEFDNLRPGRYWVNADASLRCYYNERVQVGSSEVADNPYAPTHVDHYVTEQRYWDQGLNYRLFIDVHADGDVVELDSELMPVPENATVVLQAEKH